MHGTTNPPKDVFNHGAHHHQQNMRFKRNLNLRLLLFLPTGRQAGEGSMCSKCREWNNTGALLEACVQGCAGLFTPGLRLQET